jgi:hypothetical protein
VPRSPLLNAIDDEEGEPGYFALEQDGLWSEDEDLPDNWLDPRNGNIKERYRAHRPQRLWVLANGSLSEPSVAGAIEGWWEPRPMLLCPRCRASYDLRETSDFRKLITLSQTGRSTATTIIGAGAILGLRNDSGIDVDAQKLLSFTDNRQDASLQAGHLNDFTQVVLLRGALSRALGAMPELAHEDHLYTNQLRLPDFAQYTPADDVFLQPDFYYQRRSAPGICIFIDGPYHEGDDHRDEDRRGRDALEDRGFRVIAITADESLSAQIDRYSDVFCPVEAGYPNPAKPEPNRVR